MEYVSVRLIKPIYDQLVSIMNEVTVVDDHGKTYRVRRPAVPENASKAQVLHMALLAFMSPYLNKGDYHNLVSITPRVSPLELQEYVRRLIPGESVTISRKSIQDIYHQNETQYLELITQLESMSELISGHLPEILSSVYALQQGMAYVVNYTMPERTSRSAVAEYQSKEVIEINNVLEYLGKENYRKMQLGAPLREPVVPKDSIPKEDVTKSQPQEDKETSKVSVKSKTETRSDDLQSIYDELGEFEDY